MARRFGATLDPKHQQQLGDRQLRGRHLRPGKSQRCIDIVQPVWQPRGSILALARSYSYANHAKRRTATSSRRESPRSSATEAPDIFPGFYTLHITTDGRISGMLSVNAYTG